MAKLRRTLAAEKTLRGWGVTEEATIEADIWTVWNFMYSQESTRLADPTVVPCGRLPGTGPGVGEIQVVLHGSPPAYLTGLIIEQCQPPTYVVHSSLDHPALPRTTTAIQLTPRADRLTHVRYRIDSQVDNAADPRSVDMLLKSNRTFIRDYLRTLQRHLAMPAG